jgi:hypothetical protein
MSAAEDPRRAGERPVSAIVWVDANGTMWRLRSLAAMGHGATRLAAALGVQVETVQKILRGEVALLCTELRDRTSQLWEAWWDKRPPESTKTERQAAAEARRRAERNKWCSPAGLDEDELDEPGYRPYSEYRPASGVGVAGDLRAAWEWPADSEQCVRDRR